MNELRQDIVSGDWVLIAPGRATRPHFLDEKKPKRKPSLKSTCPFEDLEKSGNWPPSLIRPNEKNWRIAVVKNKYPAVTHIDGCSTDFKQGLYSLKTAAGEHDLVITRDHVKNFAGLSLAEASGVFGVFQELHKRAMADKCNAYIATFANWGPSSGASIFHPHYQLLALPIIPPHIVSSIHGVERYWQKHRKCVRCEIVRNETKERVRIVAENKHGIAFTPFASKKPFEMQIVPKKHLAYFGKTPADHLSGMASLLQFTLKMMKKRLNDPDYNFYIHEAPLDHGKYDHHHWHIEIVPKTSTMAGFELSTGIDINVVSPEAAAKLLRGKRVAHS